MCYCSITTECSYSCIELGKKGRERRGGEGSKVKEQDGGGKC